METTIESEDYTKPTAKNTRPMAQKQCEMFIHCSMGETNLKRNRPDKLYEVDKSKLPPLSSIVQDRIEGMELPIKFTMPALLAVSALATNPGEAVILLMDCLTKHKGEELDMEKLSLVYPSGFYTKETFETVAQEAEDRKRPWSEVYNNYDPLRVFEQS